ncbi:helix-turn-helix domain-containing protein [Nocardia sp. CA-120079]|uniref:helix-turn-helix domain-containing protein n=1 Tax=Nocardia sp. CA-120079 TaxID=3239974 RepID=UPI003D96F819
MRHAVAVMASAQHQPVPLITKLMQVSESYVRQVIHDFDEKRIDALDPNGARAGRRRPIRRHVIGSVPSPVAARVIWAGHSRCGVCRSW